MRRIILFCLALLLAQVTWAEELSEKSLEGSWLIVTFMGQPAEDKDYWEFENGKFVQNLSGHRISPDKYTVQPGIIDLGFAQIKVLSFDGENMTADMAGFEYTLHKE